MYLVFIAGRLFSPHDLFGEFERVFFSGGRRALAEAQAQLAQIVLFPSLRGELGRLALENPADLILCLKGARADVDSESPSYQHPHRLSSAGNANSAPPKRTGPSPIILVDFTK